MTTFHIGTQHAATINNVGGDMVVAAGAWSPTDVAAALRGLQLEIARLRLPPAEAARIETFLDATASEPDPRRIADRLADVTSTLAEAGALTTAGVGLVDGLRRTAAALGPAGKALLAVLPLAL